MKKILEKFSDYLTPAIIPVTITSLSFGLFTSWLFSTNGSSKFLGSIILLLLFVIWALLSYINKLLEKKIFDFQLIPLNIKYDEGIFITAYSDIHLETGSLIVMIYQDSLNSFEKEIGIFVIERQLSVNNKYLLKHYYSDNISPYIKELLDNNHEFLKRIELKHLINTRVLEKLIIEREIEHD